MGAGRGGALPTTSHPGELSRPGAWLNVRHTARSRAEGAGTGAGSGTLMTVTIVKNATCTFCGCVCDDIELHAEGDRIIKSKNACSLGDAWFQNHTAERLFPDALVDGKPATLDHAIETAARLLYDADMPLVYGLSNITCEAQREAVALAELIGGVIDSHTSL